MANKRKPTEIAETRRRKILLFIFEFCLIHEYCPDIREIARAANITSTSVANYYLETLHKEGLIVLVPRLSRTIHLSPEGKELVRSWLRVNTALLAEYALFRDISRNLQDKR